MRRPDVLRAWAITLVTCVAVVFSCSTSAQVFSADVVGTGTLVAWLSGLELLASIAGRIQLTGEAELGGRTVAFLAEGALRGFGVRGLLTLISEGWIGFVAAGSTADDRRIEIRGLLHVRRKSLVPLQAGDVFGGSQHAVILFNGVTHSFNGEFLGTVEGGLEASETPGTIQLGGTGTVHLGGTPGGPPASIPLDHPALTPEFLQYVAELGF